MKREHVVSLIALGAGVLIILAESAIRASLLRHHPVWLLAPGVATGLIARRQPLQHGVLLGALVAVTICYPWWLGLSGFWYLSHWFHGGGPKIIASMIIVCVLGTLAGYAIAMSLRYGSHRLSPSKQ